MKIHLRSVLIFLLCGTVLFQDTIDSILHVGVLSYFDELLILGYFLSALVHGAKKGFPRASATLLLFVLTFFFIGVISCVFNSSYRWSELLPAGFLTIKFFLLVFSVMVFPPRMEDAARCIKTLKVLGAVVFASGVINFLFPRFWHALMGFVFLETRIGFVSAMGLFVHPGQYGWFMLLMAFLYYVEYRYQRRNKSKYYMALFILGAILSLRAKVILSLLVVLLADTFFLHRGQRQKGRSYAVLLGALTLFGVFGQYLSDTFEHYFTRQESGVSARYALMNGSLNILLDYMPFGVGFGKFGSWYAKLHYSDYYYQYGLNTVYGLKPEDPRYATDTFWPAIMGETGVLGTAVYLAAILWILVFLYRVSKPFVTAGRQDMGTFCSMFALLVMVQSLCESLGEPIFNSSPQNIVIGFLCGFAMSKRVRQYEKGRSSVYEDRCRDHPRPDQLWEPSAELRAFSNPDGSRNDGRDHPRHAPRVRAVRAVRRKTPRRQSRETLSSLPKKATVRRVRKVHRGEHSDRSMELPEKTDRP